MYNQDRKQEGRSSQWLTSARSLSSRTMTGWRSRMASPSPTKPAGRLLPKAWKPRAHAKQSTRSKPTAAAAACGLLMVSTTSTKATASTQSAKRWKSAERTIKSPCWTGARWGWLTAKPHFFIFYFISFFISIWF